MGGMFKGGYLQRLVVMLSVTTPQPKRARERTGPGHRKEGDYLERATLKGDVTFSEAQGDGREGAKTLDNPTSPSCLPSAPMGVPGWRTPLGAGEQETADLYGSWKSMKHSSLKG